MQQDQINWETYREIDGMKEEKEEGEDVWFLWRKSQTQPVSFLLLLWLDNND